MTFTLDDATPVLVGAGQVSERPDDLGYVGRSPVELAAAAALAALADTGVAPQSVAGLIDTVAATRLFDESVPGGRSPMGRTDNLPRSVAERIGADPRRAVLEVAGGQSPQHLVTEFAAEIAAGRSQACLIVGAEAISTGQLQAAADQPPTWDEHVGGDLDDRGYGLAGIITMHLVAHGLSDTTTLYALLENARRARLSASRAEYARAMGELFAPFTEVAAKNPHAAAPVELTAQELATPSAANRPIADPYTRYLVARDKVNQGAAVLLMSVAAARRAGIPEDRYVYLHGHADLRERSLLDRPDLGAAPALAAAARLALEMAGITADDVATFDLYSCYPIAVTVVAEALGLPPDDPRGLTVTGGLPFFGGPGNTYSLHAIAETVHRTRSAPGEFGFVGANGGILSKYSAAVYSTTPVVWRPGRSAPVQAALDAAPAPVLAQHADGPATIESFTVRHGRDGHRSGIVIGRLDADDRRFVATVPDGDDEMLGLLAAEQPVGAAVVVRSSGPGNRVTTTLDRMNTFLPQRVPAFRDRYEHALVHRDGHLLEVTINRPESRNSLHPAANAELDEIFDAYFADDDLWVAILTGAGTRAFSAGNDLIHALSGAPVWVPRNGFAGLTARPGMTKPVIAAVNGYAMGGGFEIALACHLVVADDAAQFALSEVRVGLVAAAGGVVRLPRTLPVKVATEMILTGRRMAAAEALRWGLITQITPPGEALAGARSLAERILKSSPTSVRVALQLMNETAAITDPVDAAGHHTPALDDLITSQDAIEGLTAFATKRSPVWRNR